MDALAAAYGLLRGVLGLFLAVVDVQTFHEQEQPLQLLPLGEPTPERRVQGTTELRQQPLQSLYLLFKDQGLQFGSAETAMQFLHVGF